MPPNPSDPKWLWHRTSLSRQHRVSLAVGFSSGVSHPSGAEVPGIISGGLKNAGFLCVW